MANTYPNSLITLYKTGIKKELNCYVDDLSTYLGSLTPIHSSPFTCQYIKHDLKLRVKLALGEGNQVMSGINYCKIQNFDNSEAPEQPMYYFIDDAKVVSQNTLELNLTLDTVNSLGQQVNDAGKPSNFLKTTHIEREHEDRFKKPLNWNPANGGYLYRKIDKESEGTSPMQIRTGNLKLAQTGSDYDWFLIYRKSADTANYAVRVDLCASTSIRVGVGSSGASKTFTRTDFDQGKYYYFLDIDNANGVFNNITINSNINKCTGTTYFSNVYSMTSAENRSIRAWVFLNDGTDLKYTCIYDNPFLIANGTSSQSAPKLTYCGNQNSITTGQIITYAGLKWTTISNATCTQGNFFRVSNVDYTETIHCSEGIKALVSQQAGIYVGSATSQMLNTDADIDRTDSTLIKIIKLPYCPIEFTKTGTTYDFGANWVYNLGYMRFQGNSLPSLINTECTSFNLGETRRYFAANSVGYNKAKDIGLESKLYHSDFYTAKMVYDSFSLPIKLENISPYDNATTTTVNVDFKPTGTINSKFAFKINPASSFGSLADVEDYGKFLVCTRNNEETILNDEYINYIKYGIDYDKKQNAIAAENAQRQATWTTVGSTAGTLASLLALIFGGPATKVAGAIGLGTSVIGGISSTTNAWANYNNLVESQNNAMAQKLAQLQNQAASVSGTDDVDLMSYYSDNRLHLMRYELNDQLKTALVKALDLTGYSHSVYDTPKVNTRIWYNYIKCTPVLKENDYRQDWKDDLISRYSQGITVLHHNKINNVNTWDFDQQYENYETWIVEGVN